MLNCHPLHLPRSAQYPNIEPSLNGLRLSPMDIVHTHAIKCLILRPSSLHAFRRDPAVLLGSDLDPGLCQRDVQSACGHCIVRRCTQRFISTTFTVWERSSVKLPLPPLCRHAP